MVYKAIQPLAWQGGEVAQPEVSLLIRRHRAVRGAQHCLLSAHPPFSSLASLLRCWPRHLGTKGRLRYPAGARCLSAPRPHAGDAAAPAFFPGSAGFLAAGFSLESWAGREV